MGVHDRRFSGAYSAFLQQRRFVDGWTAHDYLIELRKDALLARTIVLPDSYILDGRYFVTSAPEALRKALSRGAESEHAIEVRTRRGTLEESLRALLLVADDEFLNPFSFNTISDPAARHALAKELGRRTRNDLTSYLEQGTVRGMIALLHDALASAGYEAPEDLDRLEAGWSRWIADPELRVMPWDARMDLNDAVRNDLVQPEAELTTTLGRSLYTNLLASIRHGHTNRAREMLRLNEERGQTVLNAEEEDLETLRRWYDQNRHRALARQHHCSAYVHGEDLGVHPVGSWRRFVQRVVAGEKPGGADRAVGAPREFLDTLGNMSPSAFAQLALAHEADLQRWWQLGELDLLRRLVDGVMTRSAAWQDRQSTIGTLVEFLAPPALGVSVAVATSDPIAGAVAGGLGSWLIVQGKGQATGRATGRVVEFLTEHTEHLP